MFIDKSTEVLVKTSKGITNTAASLINSTKDIAVNTTVNYTPDFYDKHQDFSTGETKFLIGNSVMIGRSVIRSGYNVSNLMNRSSKVIRKRQIRKKKNQLNETTNQLNKLKIQEKNLKNVVEKESSGISGSGLSTSYLDLKIRNKRNHIIDLKRKKSKLEYKQNKLDKKYSRNVKKSLHPYKSTKRIMNNQSRKLASVIKSKDDFGSQTIGTTMKSIWKSRYFARYAKRTVPLFKRVVGVLRNMLSGMITIITSLPAIITTIVTSLPLILIIMVVSIVISCFASTTYTGRIGVLYTKINELNTIYEVELDPAEVLAITDVLEWSTQNEECYEQLVSLMLDQKKGNTLSFEQMAYNVFIKYNPATKYDGDGVYDNKMKTGYHYWSLEGFDINFIINNPVRRDLMYKEYLDLYPLYRDGNSSMRKTLSSKGVQQKEIENAKKSIEINRKRYEDYIYEYNLGEIDITVTGDNTKGIKIVKKALTKLGCHYVWGAGHGNEYRNPNLDEFDCSGFVSWSFYQAGIDIGSRTTKELVKMGEVVLKNNIQAGDIIVYYDDSTSQGHVVIYIGNDKVVHAPHTGDVVKVSKVDSFINKKGASIRRLY